MIGSAACRRHASPHCSFKDQQPRPDSDENKTASLEALRPHRCSVAEFRWQSPVWALNQGGGVDPGRAPRGVGVRLAPACRNYRQLPANWGRVWLRLTSLSGQKAAGGHLEVESDSKSDCWQKQFYFTFSCCWFLFFTLLTSRCLISDLNDVLRWI